MSYSKEPKRDYNKPDRDMLEQGQGMHNSLVEHLPEFTLKYPFIDVAYCASFQTLIDDANEVVRDSEVVSDTSLDVSVINGYMSEGKVAYMNVIHYAELVYPNNPKMVNTFGLKDYEEYSRVHNLLPVILKQAFRKANNAVIKPLLIAKGLTLADIANLDTIADKILAELMVIYDDKVERLPTTGERITKYNLLWSRLSEVSACSKEVYMNNWAMRQMFLLYPGSDGTPPPPIPPIPPIVEE